MSPDEVRSMQLWWIGPAVTALGLTARQAFGDRAGQDRPERSDLPEDRASLLESAHILKYPP